MKVLFATLLLFTAATGFAKSTHRTPASSTLPQGSWTCMDPSNGHNMSPFYIRKDKSSSAVTITHVKDNPNNAECYDVSFKWNDSGASFTDAECCPTGMN